jgi:hypothetical protein
MHRPARSSIWRAWRHIRRSRNNGTGGRTRFGRLFTRRYGGWSGDKARSGEVLLHHRFQILLVFRLLNLFGQFGGKGLGKRATP